MLGQKVRDFRPLTAVSLEDLVPEYNFYRQVERTIDLSFVRDLADDFYSKIGRPSIDPVVFFKLQLIAFFEGIRSERKLMETVNLNLAHRWFIGYDLDEPVPDHSSLSKIRERFGLESFQLFFERIVELCIEAGLVWGEELYFDSTKVQASASINGMIDRTEFEAQQHLNQLFEHLEDDASPFGKLVAKYNGERLHGIRKPHYHRITDDRISLTDPDAAPMHPSGGDSAVLGYRDHYVVDGGKARIILSALVTPASIMDNTPIPDLVDWVCFRWELNPKRATGDAKYGTVPNIVGLEERGIKAYLPTLISAIAPSTIRPNFSSMIPRTTIMFVPRDNYFHLLLEEKQSRFWFINSKQPYAMPFQKRPSVPVAKVGAISSDRYFRNVSIKRKLIAKPKNIKRPCVSGACGSSRCSEKQRSFTG